MAFELLKDTIKEIEEIISRYPTKQAAALPALHLVQRDNGYISDEALDFLADMLELPKSVMHDTVSFYTMYYRKEMGKYVVQVCSTLSCSLLDSKKIVKHIEKKLGLKSGETTSDMRFSLIKVECLGSCGTAPVMRINNDYYEDLTPEKVDEILDKLP